MRLDEGEYLAHYGILRRSGRYPWGSGRTPLQRSKTFLDITNEMRSQGMSDSEIAKSFHTKEYPFTSADLRALRSRSTTLQKQEQIRSVQRLKDKGMGNSAIARQMNLNESTVRSLLEPGRQEQLDILQSTASMLKRQVAEKEFVDVGSSTEKALPLGDNPAAKIPISPDKFKTALSMVKEEGYNVHDVYMPQVGTGEITRYKVLTKPGVTRKEAFANRDKIRPISEKTDDGGRSFTDSGFKPPLHIDPKRIAVRYKEDGGADADGVIYVRPGKEDITLGKSRYAQVRIAVGGTHYLKGMAIYKDDLPPGVDLMFNTNKSNTGNKLDAMKPLKRDKETGEIDKDLPFGSVIKEGGQILGKNGKPISAMNLINEEGDWDHWSRNVSRQVLSKQSPDLAKSQLDLTYDRRREELQNIKSLTNPLIKRKLLETFSEEADSSAVHLKAANMPRQATKVLLPSNRVKPTEIFAPTFRDGERVALVRYPHAGTFEIPELTVNNRSREVKRMFGGRGDVPDAVAIHPKVAERLSGADFDGDAVVVIPNNRGQITHTPALEGLKGFDPQTYKIPLGPPSKKFPEGLPSITPIRKQHEMGNVTNLIADMTIKGATSEEKARAVRHSMVVIDSEKHNLDFRASARDHGILDLKKKYQGVHPVTGQARGAATLITRATSEAHPVKRKPASVKDRPDLARLSVGTIDRKTGRKVFTFTGERKPNGALTTFRSTRLAETHDAYSLVSEGRGTRIEQIYADHSNRLKSMANEARLAAVGVKLRPYSPSAKKVYAPEVAELNSKLNRAEMNQPLERRAQVVANHIVGQKKRANPEMEKDELKKIKGQALKDARLRTGAGKTRITVTDREWEAIQAGAISNHRLERILNNADIDSIRERATPQVRSVMTDVMTTRARQMLTNGYTFAEVSDALQIPMSTLKSGVE
ncbi:MAG: helix-turn-helix domain-containing protein [Ktedonobacteraceae bacterium]